MLEQTPGRARKFFAKRSSSGPESAAKESAGGARRGPPDALDEKAIAAKLKQANVARPKNGMLAGDSDAHAEALAKSLVEQAAHAVEKLEGGGTDGALSVVENVALEAVLHTRGRPALKVEGERIETLDDTAHPGSGFWRAFLSDNEDRIVTVANATGAVRVTDSTASWVQGTAWLVGKNLAMTNRHVLFPQLGVQLARRHDADRETARMRTGLTVALDFAFDNGPPGRNRICKVLGVPYVSLEGDPIDVALLEIEPLQESQAATPLIVSRATFDFDQLYIVGHPGRLETVPSEVNAVFGSPDEHKRVSFGELMDANSAFPNELIHDASTIGGYSGGCVLGFTSLEVIGLHFLGDSTAGNRAFKAAALRTHKVNSFLG
jgi:hypothetical protein